MKLFISFAIAGVLLIAANGYPAEEKPASEPQMFLYDHSYIITNGDLQGQAGRRFCGLRIEPCKIELQMIPRDLETNITVLVGLEKSPRLKVTEVECPSDKIQVGFHEEQVGKKYAVEIATKPPLTYGKLDTKLILRTDEPWRPNLWIPVTATITGALDVAEWEIVVPFEDAQWPWNRFVRITARDGRPFNILRIDPPSDSVVVDLIRQPREDQYLIRLIVKPDQSLKGRVLRIVTDVPTMEEFTIPFRVSRGVWD